MSTILITGASRGIGASIAIKMAKEGFNLVLWARHERDLKEVKEKCDIYGVDVTTASVDVSDPDAVLTIGDQSLSEAMPLQGVVVNAGSGIWGKITDLSVADWRNTLATNLDGAFYTLKACLPYIEPNFNAQIVIMGSDSSLNGYPTRSAYCASKFGLSGLTESLRRETRNNGIRVTNLILSRVDSYFRDKKPGMRPQSMSVKDIADTVAWVFSLESNLEVRELHLSSITSTFGILPEFYEN